jgi:hypothetical protein
MGTVLFVRCISIRVITSFRSVKMSRNNRKMIRHTIGKTNFIGVK